MQAASLCSIFDDLVCLRTVKNRIRGLTDQSSYGLDSRDSMGTEPHASYPRRFEMSALEQLRTIYTPKTIISTKNSSHYRQIATQVRPGSDLKGS